MELVVLLASHRQVAMPASGQSSGVFKYPEAKGRGEYGRL